MKASAMEVLLVTYKFSADGVGGRDREVNTYELSGLGELCLRAVSSVRMADDGLKYFALYKVILLSFIPFSFFFTFPSFFKCRKWYAVIFFDLFAKFYSYNNYDISEVKKVIQSPAAHLKPKGLHSLCLLAHTFPIRY